MPSQEENNSADIKNMAKEPASASDQMYPFQVSLSLETDDCNPPASGWVEQYLKKIAALAGIERGYINILVTDDKNMADYHQQYSGIAGTTDVLTFDMGTTTWRKQDDRNAGKDHGLEAPATVESRGQNTVEGDIIICIDQARRQAEKRTHEVRLEVLLYAVHGLLHLLGEDDHNDQDYQKMHRREDKLLTDAGLSAVFSKEYKEH